MLGYAESAKYTPTVTDRKMLYYSYRLSILISRVLPLYFSMYGIQDAFLFFLGCRLSRFHYFVVEVVAVVAVVFIFGTFHFGTICWCCDHNP